MAKKHERHRLPSLGRLDPGLGFLHPHVQRQLLQLWWEGLLFLMLQKKVRQRHDGRWIILQLQTTASFRPLPSLHLRRLSEMQTGVGFQIRRNCYSLHQRHHPELRVRESRERHPLMQLLSRRLPNPRRDQMHPRQPGQEPHSSLHCRRNQRCRRISYLCPV